MAPRLKLQDPCEQKNLIPQNQTGLRRRQASLIKVTVSCFEIKSRFLTKFKILILFGFHFGIHKLRIGLSGVEAGT